MNNLATAVKRGSHFFVLNPGYFISWCCQGTVPVAGWQNAGLRKQTGFFVSFAGNVMCAVSG
jgi:hypothetical protein